MADAVIQRAIRKRMPTVHAPVASRQGFFKRTMGLEPATFGLGNVARRRAWARLGVLRPGPTRFSRVRSAQLGTRQPSALGVDVEQKVGFVEAGGSGCGSPIVRSPPSCTSIRWARRDLTRLGATPLRRKESSAPLHSCFFVRG